MPKYKKKITRQMNFREFIRKIENLPIRRQAFISVLYWSGCRVSEALALTKDDLFFNLDNDIIYFNFHRLKGSKQTDPIPLPFEYPLISLADADGVLFPWSRMTGYRIVKKAFPDLYPHFFRQNRFTKIAEKHALAQVISFSGLAPTSVSHYIAKVDIKKVGKSLKEEIDK